jgi:hypothetical protein
VGVEFLWCLDGPTAKASRCSARTCDCTKRNAPLIDRRRAHEGWTERCNGAVVQPPSAHVRTVLQMAAHPSPPSPTALPEFLTVAWLAEAGRCWRHDLPPHGQRRAHQEEDRHQGGSVRSRRAVRGAGRVAAPQRETTP